MLKLFDTGVHSLEVKKQEGDEPDDAKYSLTAIHKMGSRDVHFPFSQESTGTQRLLGLADAVIDALDNGSLLLVDELGSNIHPRIARRLVKWFQNSETNPNKAQLFFTSHDNTLWRNQLLRRDQIWLTKKVEDGSTKVYPLSDFKQRNDKAIDKAYLEGLYGGVPILPFDEAEPFVMQKGDVK